MSYFSERILTKFSDKESFYKNKEFVYFGIDCTYSSLHIGHLIGINCLRLLERDGFTPVVLLGIETALIGDPTGKNVTRKTLNQSDAEIYAYDLYNQLKNLLGPKIIIRTNGLGDLYNLDEIITLSGNFSVKKLLLLETFSQRLKNGQHLSLKELLYPLFQALDWKILSDEVKTLHQIGGSDQWGNMSIGKDFQGRGNEFATFDILSSKKGIKMSKSENNAVWLSSKLFSPFQFWQYFRNIRDEEVDSYINNFTLDFERDQDINRTKIYLADYVTEWVHGKDTLSKVHEEVKNKFGENAI